MQIYARERWSRGRPKVIRVSSGIVERRSTVTSPLLSLYKQLKSYMTQRVPTSFTDTLNLVLLMSGMLESS